MRERLAERSCYITSNQGKRSYDMLVDIKTFSRLTMITACTRNVVTVCYPPPSSPVSVIGCMKSLFDFRHSTVPLHSAGTLPVNQ